ncbi:C40 family peptidase [Actinocrinis puniceicyclus]|uniref:C40 family peptidase n=1 Tax=Actinocrinis puniceicyclus TaxID=977794 RepID=A0A8J7WI33_9ACTN|nr:C40 family peptidase [Actinocrinis puniceicyclus]MBS2961713.1 C40 family peptidase [Actinocrinis puniceicyclus]
MASHRAPKVTGRATAAAATVVGVTAGTVALLPGTSQASPTPSLSQVKAEVQQLNNQAEQKTNAYDAAQEQYAQLQKKIDGLQAQITQEQSALDTLESTMGLQAAAQYRNGGISPTLQLALNASPEKYLSQAGIASQQADQEAVLMRSITQEKAQLLQDKKNEANALQQQQAVLDQAKAAKTAVDAKLAERKALMSTLTAQQQQQVNSAGGTTTYTGALPATSGRAAMAVEYAKSKLGDSYVYGATGPSYFDCSGLTMAAWAYAGVSIPRTSEEQFAGLSQFYSASQLQPGDLIFFEGNPPGHVAIYVGNGMYIHAPHTGTVVQYGSLDPSSPYYGYMSVTGYARV